MADETPEVKLELPETYHGTCSYCSMAFDDIPTLRKHRRECFLDNVKSEQCLFCGSFFTKRDVEAHRKVCKQARINRKRKIAQSELAKARITRADIMSRAAVLLHGSLGTEEQEVEVVREEAGVDVGDDLVEDDVEDDAARDNNQDDDVAEAIYVEEEIVSTGVKKRSNVGAQKTVVFTGYLCTFCSATFSTAEGYDEHLTSDHEQPRKHSCSICSELFASLITLNTHAHEAHQTTDLHHLSAYKCSDCSAMFTNPHDVRAHTSTIHRGMPYICSCCGIQVAQLTGLTHHIISMHGAIYYQCSMCNMNFVQSPVVGDHMRLVHPGSRNYFICDVCDQSLLSKSALESHIRTVHVKRAEVPFARQMHSWTYWSRFCDTRYVVEWGRSGELLTVEYLTCSSCALVSKARTSMRNHLMAVHFKDRKHVCTQCGASFFNKSQLFVHLRCIHEKSRPFRCPMCDQAFSLDGNMKQHMYRKHRNDMRLQHSVLGAVAQS